MSIKIKKQMIMANMNVPTNLKLIESGNVPTTTNLTSGQMAFGAIGGGVKLYVNPNTSVVDLTGIPDVPIAEAGDIIQTNITTGSFYLSVLNSDGTLYFGGFLNGIWKLDNATGSIVQTNKTGDSFITGGLSSDGTLYFCGDGIFKLDNVTGDFVTTNVSIYDNYRYGGLSSDGTLYFTGNGKGILKLDNVTGNIVQTNKTNGTFKCVGLSSDGTLYFASTVGDGIWKLNNVTGNIVVTNINTGYFQCGGLSSDGTLYFGGSFNNGIWKLNNVTGNIVQTNKTDFTFEDIALNSDGILYFAAGNRGIWKLDNVTGDIVATNKTTGAFYQAILSSDGTLYFNSDNGIWKLDNVTGDIVVTNITTGQFLRSAGLSSDGTLYFGGSNNGIWKLPLPPNNIYGRIHGEWVVLDGLSSNYIINGENTGLVNITSTDDSILLNSGVNNNIQLTTQGTGIATYKGNEIATVDKIPTVVQSTGTSTTSVMSQDAVTFELNKIPTIVQNTGTSTTSVMSQNAVTTALGNFVINGWADTPKVTIMTGGDGGGPGIELDSTSGGSFRLGTDIFDPSNYVIKYDGNLLLGNTSSSSNTNITCGNTGGNINLNTDFGSKALYNGEEIATKADIIAAVANIVGVAPQI